MQYFKKEWSGLDYDYKLSRNSRKAILQNGKIITLPQSKNFTNKSNDDFKGFEDNYLMFNKYCPKDLYEKYKDKCNDLRFIIAKKR